MLKAYGINLQRILFLRHYVAFIHRRLRSIGWPQDYMVRVLKNLIIPKMNQPKIQVGVKEIRNKGWKNYRRHFPDMKVILTGRDPRDIYISTYYHRQRIGKVEPMSPHAITNELKREFRLQLQMKNMADILLVRYEDLCQDSSIIEKIKRFVHSPIKRTGKIGQFNLMHPHRRKEAQLHGGQITTKHVSRWRQEKNQQLVQEAQACFNLMQEYVEFWGYEQ